MPVRGWVSNRNPRRLGVISGITGEPFESGHVSGLPPKSSNVTAEAPPYIYFISRDALYRMGVDLADGNTVISCGWEDPSTVKERPMATTTVTKTERRMTNAQLTNELDLARKAADYWREEANRADAVRREVVTIHAERLNKVMEENNELLRRLASASEVIVQLRENHKKQLLSISLALSGVASMAEATVEAQ